jgi:hypothetical protein
MRLAFYILLLPPGVCELITPFVNVHLGLPIVSCYQRVFKSTSSGKERHDVNATPFNHHFVVLSLIQPNLVTNLSISMQSFQRLAKFQL